MKIVNTNDVSTAGDTVTRQIQLCISGDIKGKIDFSNFAFSELVMPPKTCSAEITGFQLVNYSISESATGNIKRCGNYTVEDGTFSNVKGVKGCFIYTNNRMTLKAYARTATMDIIERRAEITDLEFLVTVEFTVDKDYGSLVKNNLMKEKFYTPYCGSDNCSYGMPRTKWFSGQFMCSCGWVSEFDAAFIKEYRKKWLK